MKKVLFQGGGQEYWGGRAEKTGLKGGTGGNGGKSIEGGELSIIGRLDTGEKLSKKGMLARGISKGIKN